jgi:hypothetical protein
VNVDGRWLALGVAAVAGLSSAARGSPLRALSSNAPSWERKNVAFPGGMHFRTGEFFASYRDLVRAFGRPTELDDDRSTFEWVFVSPVGLRPFTLYEYKMTKHYSSSGYSRRELERLPSVEWHIGGTSEADVPKIKTFLEQAVEAAKKKPVKRKSGSSCCGGRCSARGRGSFS